MKVMIALKKALACMAITLAAATAYPQTSPQRVSFNIRAQSMEAALTEFGATAGLQVFFPSKLTADKAAPEVVGTLSAEEALKKLLEGSALRYEFINATTVAIREEGEGKEKPVALENAQPPSLRMAQAEPTQKSESVTGQASVPDTGDEPQALQLEEIVVTGTHIRGTAVSAPLVSIDRDGIERTGFSSVEALMESIPQNFGEISPDGRFATEGGSTLSRINNDRTSSVNLRGLGAQSTLTLLDGTRQAGSVGGRVFDVSMLPLSMVERVDVVTGGHSAIYGADAVAGVVNFVTRREFDGFETQVSYGGAADGGERLQAAQLAGMTFDRGGFALGYDYSHDRPFDLADAGLLSDQPIAAAGGIIEKSLQTQADTVRHSGFLSGHYRLTDRLEGFASGLYTDKRFESVERALRPGAPADSITTVKHPASFSSANAGLRLDISKWRATLSGATSTTRQKDDPSRSVTVTATTSTTGIFIREDKAEVSSASLVAEGPLFASGAFEPRLATGIEVLADDFRGTQVFNGFTLSNADLDRSVNSAFAELLIPIVQDGKARALRSLELSAAGRYDDYSDFGDSFNPQFALMWEPARGIRVRGSYSTSFRAPALAELTGANFAFISNVTDPQSTTGGTTPLLVLAGDNPGLGPENADTWNASLELEPAFLPNTHLTLAYFNVKYRDRIEAPVVGFAAQLAALTQEQFFSQLIERAPDLAALQAAIDLSNASQGFNNLSGTAFGTCGPAGRCNPTAQSLLAAFPTVVLFDDRKSNIALEKADGLDFNIDSELATASGKLTYGANITYTFDHTRNLTATSPASSLLDEVGKPVALRMRANLGWSRGAYGVFGYLNYVDDYANHFSTPASRMSSWTTVDLTLRFDGSELAHGSALQGIKGTLSIDNALDKTPPRYANSSFAVLYDSTNADPFGRYLSLSLVKEW